jgi:dTDP-glucose 4,6-dehydratase
VTGILALLDSGHSGPMNIGNPAELTMLDLAETIVALSGSDSQIVFVPRPEDDPQVRQPDVTLATAEIGWKPEVPLREGLSRTIEWFREEGNSRV